MSFRTHIKILGYLYTALASFVSLFAVLVLIVSTVQGNLSQAGIVVPIVLGLAMWWFQTGLGLLRYRRAARLYAIIVAVIFMVGLNAIFLLAGGKPFNSSTGWIVFHLTCISIGVYTLVVLSLPGSGEVLH